MAERTTFRWGVPAILLPIFFILAWVQFRWLGVGYVLIGCTLGLMFVYLVTRFRRTNEKRADQDSK